MRLVCFLRRINRYNSESRYDWYVSIYRRRFELSVTLWSARAIAASLS